MAQPTPAIYTVHDGDTLSGIAQRFYGDGTQWHRIYDYCNKQVIGSNPDVIRAGEVLYIPQIVPIVTKTCKITFSNLNVRAAPNTQSTIIDNFPHGTVLTFFEVKIGENVDGNNPRWGHSDQGYYFWLGGTDHPNG